MGQSMDPLRGLVDLGLDLVGEVVEDVVNLFFNIVPVELELADGLVDKVVGVMDNRVKCSRGGSSRSEEERRGCER